MLGKIFCCLQRVQVIAGLGLDPFEAIRAVTRLLIVVSSVQSDHKLRKRNSI
jgi:hypothetical protein